MEGSRKYQMMPKKLEKVYGRIRGYLASTHIDEHGQQLSKEALEKLYKWTLKNPLLYYEHDLSKPPCGRIINQKIVKINNHLAIEVEAEVINPKVWKEIEEGKLRGFSVGMKILELKLVKEGSN